MGQVSKEQALQSERFASTADFSRLYRFYQAVFLSIIGLPMIAYDFIVFALKIEGREKLKHKSLQSCILISNHSLYLDPAIIIRTLLPHRAYYFALKSHFHHPVGGVFIRLLGGIPIPDVRGMRRAEKTTAEALVRGYRVHFFPEGEMKHLNQDIAPFQSGAFFMALRLNTPIVPITLIHRPRTLFGKQVSKYFIRVRCVVGEPVVPQRLENESIREAADRLAAEAHRTMAKTIISGHRTL